MLVLSEASTRVRTYANAQVQIRMDIHACVHAYTDMFACVHACMVHAYVQAYIRSHMCTCRKTDMHTYVHDRPPALVWQRRLEPTPVLPPLALAACPLLLRRCDVSLR